MRPRTRNGPRRDFQEAQAKHVAAQHVTGAVLCLQASRNDTSCVVAGLAFPCLDPASQGLVVCPEPSSLSQVHEDPQCLKP